MLSKARNIAVVAAATLAVAAPAAGAAAPQPSDSTPASSAQQQQQFGWGGFHCYRHYFNGHWIRVCRWRGY
jgi:hypothetical protein